MNKKMFIIDGTYSFECRYRHGHTVAVVDPIIVERKNEIEVLKYVIDLYIKYNNASFVYFLESYNIKEIP